MAGVKIKSPFVWDGKPVMDIFDQWTYEVDTWIELSALSDKLALKCMVNFMGGTASKFFMDHVTTDIKKWTVKDVYKALFDYCFPADFKLRLRKRLMDAYQGKKTVRDFARDLKSLAKRFPDVTERHLVQIFWDGAEQYIRVKWLDRGMSPEDSSLEKLVKWALRFEKSKEALDREKGDWKPKPEGRTWGRFKNRTHGNEPWVPPSDNEPDKRGGKSENNSRKAADKSAKNSQGWGKQNSDKPKGKPKDKPRLSPEELDKMRAEDRCFTCKEVGHQSRNCPQKHQAKPPHQKVSVGAARYDYLKSLSMDGLAKEIKDASINVDSVRVDDDDILPDPSTLEIGTDKVWLSAPPIEVCSYIKKLWMTAYPPDDAIAEGMVPEERFTVMEYGMAFEVTDWLKCEVPYMVTREELTRADFNVMDVVNDAWDKHLSTPLRGAFNGEEPDHEYPALSWLLFRFAAALADLDAIDIDVAMERLMIDPATGGYLIFDQMTADHYFVSHGEIREPDFSACRVLSKPPPEETPTMESVARIRRRRRIMMKPRCAAVGVQPRQPKKKRKMERREEDTDHMYRTAMREKDRDRVLPRQIVVEATVNGQAVRALMDTGSMMDFISTRVVDQLKIKTDILVKPVPLYMAVSGSRSVVKQS
ncbi:hypothetical protein B0H19DRAFT_1008035, partial [Mycena capillaripes]